MRKITSLIIPICRFLFIFVSISNAQTINGVVFDESTGKPIAGVSIISSDKTKSKFSGKNGHFVIEFSNGDTLLFTHIAYEDKYFIPNSAKNETIIYLKQTKLTLDAIQVSITKNDLPDFSQSASISNLPAERIRENVSRSMAEAMTTTAGVWMQKTNHGGGSPFIRGLTGNYTLLLVDGIRLNNSTFRYGPNQYFNTISPFSVNSVEILRGGGSTLYGSDAIGGTLNISTISPSFAKNKKIYGNIGGQFMSHGMEYTGNIEISGKFNKFAYIAAGAIREFGDIYAGEGLGYEKPSAYSEKDAFAKGLWYLSENKMLTLCYQWLRQDTVPRYDKVAQADYEYYNFTLQQRQLAYLRFEQTWQNSVVKSMSLTTSFQQTNEERDTKKNNSDLNKNEREDVSTVGLNGQLNTLLANKIETIFGLDLYNDWIRSSKKTEDLQSGEVAIYPRGLYPDGSGSFSSAFYNTYLYRTIPWIFQLGWRYNYTANKAEDEMFDDLDLATSSLVWNASVNYRFNSSRIYAAVNTAFRAPNINDISSLGDFDYGIEVPAVNLKPEKSANFELGYKLATTPFNLNTAFYYTQINDLIDRVPSIFNGDSLIDGNRVYTKENVGEAFVSGFEMDIQIKITTKFSINGNLTYAYGQNVTKEEPFRRIPPLFGNVELRYAKRSYYLTVQSLIAGKQDRLSSGDKDDYRIQVGGTPGWFVLNLKGGYHWKMLEMKLAFNNIFNDAYRMHGSGVDGLGRHIAANLRLNF